MEEEIKQQPIIPLLINKFKTRRIRKKQEEIELLKLEIEKVKLDNEIREQTQTQEVGK